MSTTRREFLNRTVLMGGAAALGFGSRRGFLRDPHSHWNQAARPLRVLVLGGTGFIGPHIVQRALDRGHQVTLFNRGRTNPGLFPQVETLIGDRNDDLSALEGRRWDICLDTSATDPAWVRLSAALLKDAVDRYFFTSTRSTYSDFSRVGMTALDAPQLEVEPAALDRGDRLDYGRNKVLCEYFTRQNFGERALIVRPGLIVGPGDDTDRFTYWPWRIDQGGEVLAPGDGTDLCMFIDVRDLADWYVRLVEQGTTGAYNALSPKGGLRFDHLLYGIKAVTTAEVSFTWVDADFCLENRVRPYGEMPLWYPTRGNRVGFAQFDLSREMAVGLTWRPLAETARDTLDWYYATPAAEQEGLRGASLRPEREKEVLALWHARG
jgi:2'-hydroxyisoflavone reductase